jgi:tetratricopeptide (TPR) repeat protein/transglutaminase-like putative cysteine protease
MGLSRHAFRALVAIVLLAAARTAAASDAWPVARGPAHEPNVYHYDAKQWQTIPKDYLEDAAACVLYAGNTFLVEADGTIENITHEITRLNGRKGIEKLGEYQRIAYDPAYQTLTLNDAILHKADGRQIAVEPRHVQLRDVSTDYQVYDHEKQLIISFPNLEVGDTLEVKWTIRGKNPEHAGHFFTRYDFGDPSYPVVLDELIVRVPAKQPFKYACTGARIDPAIAEKDGQRYYDWKAHKPARLPRDENLPPKEEMQSSVVCSTFASWDEIGRWKAQLRADSWATSPEIRKVVADVTKGVADPAARARALTFWMRRNIRYVSSGEHHDYTPHPPARVFTNRFGDCKDTSQLLAVMMREAGLNVSLVTLGTLDDGQIVESVPSPWGTHAILLVRLADGEHWVDTTLSLGGWDYLPREDRDRVCYLVDASGKTELRRSPRQTADTNRFEQTTHVRVGADGSSHCERTMTAYGAAALGLRDSFVEVPAGERRRQVAAELQEANTRARLLRLTFDEAALQDYDQPVCSQMVFDLPGHFAGGARREGSLSDSKTWTRLLAFNLDYDRQAPFELPSPFESRHRYIVHLPAAYALEDVPEERTITSPWGRFEIRVKAPHDDTPVRELEISFLTRLENTRVEPAQFADYRRFQEEVGKAYRVWLTLVPSSHPADIPMLEAVLALVPEDSASAATLARLYCETGKHAEARRVLRRARYYRPDDESLWELSVHCAANADEEEAAQRELARRFPDEPKHQIALGTLLIKHGKGEAARTVLAPLAGDDGSPSSRGEAHFLLARCWDNSGKPAEALKHLAAAEDVDPESVDSPIALVLRGKVCEDLGLVRDAMTAYRKALSTTSKRIQPPPGGSPEVVRDLGECAVTVNKDTADALNGVVRLAVASNDRSAALDYLRRYAVGVGDDPSGLLQAAEHYLRLGLVEEALDLAKKASRKGNDARVEQVLGLAYVRRGEYSLAIVHLEKANPRDSSVLEATLRAMLSLGNLDGVAARLSSAKELAGQTAELRKTCDDALIVLRRREQLQRTCPAPAARQREWLRALDCLACAEFAHTRGRPAAEVEQYLAGAFVGGDGPGAAFALRGWLALDSGKLARAAADALHAVTLSPQEPAGYFVRGRVRLERNEPGALEDLQKAAELTNWHDADMLHGLADGLFRAGKTEKAVTLQREAARLKPHDSGIAEQLAVFEKATRPTGAGS